MAFAESILSAQMQDSVSRFPLVHFPLSSHSHCFQQSSRAEKNVKAKEVCDLLLRASWRAGRGRATCLHSSPDRPSHKWLEGAWVQVAISLWVQRQTGRSGGSSFVLLQVVLKSHRTWGSALACCQCGTFHTEKGTLNL